MRRIVNDDHRVAIETIYDRRFTLILVIKEEKNQVTCHLMWYHSLNDNAEELSGSCLSHKGYVHYCWNSDPVQYYSIA